MARAAKDAVAIDLLACFLLSSGEAAVGDGLIERLQAGQAVGTVRRRLAEMIKQPRMRRPKRLGMVRLLPRREVLADQRMTIDEACVSDIDLN